MIDLSGKTAMITGGSQGIGFACAQKLAEAGAAVALVGRNLEKAEAAAQRLANLPVKVIACSIDVSQESSVQLGVAQILEKLGNIDILINNAGITDDKLLMRMDAESWNRVISTNLSGSFYCIKAVIKQMARLKQGRIINMSSVLGATGNPGQANYVASKAGVVGLTKSVALEYAKKGVTVNAIAPGFIKTDMTDVLKDKVKDQILAKIPLHKFGSVDDIANTALFLASDMAGYMTGQVLHVNGGMFLGS